MEGRHTTGLCGQSCARAEQIWPKDTPVGVLLRRQKPLQLDSEFAALASAVGLAHPRLFPMTNYLSLYPKGEMGDVESFLYWSKESLGAKPIVGITHVVMIESAGALMQGGARRRRSRCSRATICSRRYRSPRLARRQTARIPFTCVPEPFAFGCVRRPVGGLSAARSPGEVQR